LDYSDFNKEHSKIGLFLLNLELARNWIIRAKRNVMQDIYLQKAYCAIWTAMSHLNSWHLEGESKAIRHWSGLWSGHRDTARDNTILHTVYSEAMKKLAKKHAGININIYYHGKCGDDEDGLHGNWVSAAIFTGAHKVCGFSLNPIKQLIGEWEHEFLQRTCNKKALPIKPLPSIIATLSTGNWYKQPANYYGSAVSSMTGMLSELIVRGCDRKLAVNVCLKIVKKMLRIKAIKEEKYSDEKQRETAKRNSYQDTKWIKLELSPFFQDLIEKEEWKTEKSSDGETEIKSGPWQGIIIPKAKIITGRSFDLGRMDELEDKLRTEEMPCRAVDDWIRMQERWVDKSFAEVYKTQLLNESYKSMFGSYSQKERIKKTKEMIPEREARIYVTDEDIPEYEHRTGEIMNELFKRFSYAKPITDDALIAKLHMDRSLFNLIGGWEGIYKYGKVKDLRFYQTVREPRLALKEKMLAAECFDTVIRSWIINRRLG
jgi:hypothetical protein